MAVRLKEATKKVFFLKVRTLRGRGIGKAGPLKKRPLMKLKNLIKNPMATKLEGDGGGLVRP